MHTKISIFCGMLHTEGTSLDCEGDLSLVFIQFSIISFELESTESVSAIEIDECPCEIEYYQTV